MIVETIGPEAADLLSALHDGARNPGERVWSAAEFAQLIAAPGAFALLARTQAAPIGFILGWTQGVDGEVHLVAVLPEHRRRGVGRALLIRAEAACRAHGGLRMILDVARDNAPARALYARAGYGEIAVRKGYYGQGAVDALVLARPLD